MKINYLCRSWQFLLQQLVYQISKGYYYYHVGIIPDDKVLKRKVIDEKIIQKYNINLDKYQRARRKKKNLANFYYLRWKNIFIILHTVGDFEKELKVDDEFKDVRATKQKMDRLSFKISPNIGFEISLKTKKGTSQRSVTISFDRETVQNLNAELEEYVKYRKLNKINQFFKRLNNIPAWSGITQQKRILQNNLYRYASKHGLNSKKKSNKNSKENSDKNRLIKFKKYYDDKKEYYPYTITTSRKIYDSKYTNDNIQDWL